MDLTKKWLKWAQGMWGNHTPVTTIVLMGMLFALAGCSDSDSVARTSETGICNLTYKLPGDVDKTPGNATQNDFDEFSWQTFLALSAPSVGGRINVNGDNTPQWRGWSSTADLLNQADPGPSGSRYYPEECKAISFYEDYRVIDQVGKVNDSFQEATEDALSTSPVIDKNGNFLRYEILISPSMYAQVVANRWNVPGTIPADPQTGTVTGDIIGTCGLATYTGGDPADKESGFIQIKNAWMDLDDVSPAERAKYHTEKLLVYTPYYRTSSTPQQATCELRTMGLVGQHIMHKTLTQPAWVYSTFEHVDNAPDCEGPSTTGGSQAGTPSDSCPPIVQKDWNFNPMFCNDDADSVRIDGCPPDPDVPVTNWCAHCNDTPGSNDATAVCMSDGAQWVGTCCDRLNPSAAPPGDCNPGTEPWCLDRPQAEVKGFSRLCRQIAVSEDEAKGGYISSARWNRECHDTIAAEGTGNSVWGNYELISTQWMSIDFAQNPTARECVNVSRDVIQYKNGSAYVALKPDIEPKPASEGGTQPVLGNTSMESYQRANCLGCHAKSTTGSGDVDNIFKNHSSTDFIYWLKLEVPYSAGT